MKDARQTSEICSKLTIKILEKYLKFVQNQKYSHNKVKRQSICQNLIILNYSADAVRSKSTEPQNYYSE